MVRYRGQSAAESRKEIWQNMIAGFIIATLLATPFVGVYLFVESRSLDLGFGEYSAEAAAAFAQTCCYFVVSYIRSLLFRRWYNARSLKQYKKELQRERRRLSRLRAEKKEKNS